MCVQFSETKTQLHTGLGSLRWSEWGWTWQRQQKTQQGVRCFYFKQGECTSSLSVHHHYLFIIVICSPSLSVHHQYLFIIIICSSSLSVNHPYLFIILICSSSLFVNPHYLFIIIIIIYLAKWRRRLCLTTFQSLVFRINFLYDIPSCYILRQSSINSPSACASYSADLSSNHNVHKYLSSHYMMFVSFL